MDIKNHIKQRAGELLPELIRVRRHIHEGLQFEEKLEKMVKVWPIQERAELH